VRVSIVLCCDLCHSHSVRLTLNPLKIIAMSLIILPPYTVAVLLFISLSQGIHPVIRYWKIKLRSLIHPCIYYNRISFENHIEISLQSYKLCFSSSQMNAINMILWEALDLSVKILKFLIEQRFFISNPVDFNFESSLIFRKS